MAESKTSSKSSAPRSVGIIMDGNRRWAKQRGLFSLQGHQAGYQKLKEVIGWAKQEGIKFVTVYAFSTENWNRQPEEVSYLMDLARIVFGKEQGNLLGEKVRIKCIGDVARLPQDLQKTIREAEEMSAEYDGLTLLVCVSYGGRQEILHAAQALLAERKADAAITEADLERHLYTAGTPDPDLIIRTGGQVRLSNFLPWQATYSELFFSSSFWPDFSREEFSKILAEYAERVRNYGK